MWRCYYLLIALIAFWSSFGPDAGLYSLLYQTIPIFTFMRAPGRMGIMVVLALLVLGRAAPRVAAGAGAPAVVAGAIVAAVAAVELAEVPLTQLPRGRAAPRRLSVAADAASRAGDRAAVLVQRMDFPRHAYYMLNSTSHWMPLINGYSDHIPQDFRDTVIALSSFPTRESFRILGRARRPLCDLSPQPLQCGLAPAAARASRDLLRGTCVR